MTLSAGTRLGPYEILSPLGAGGTGEVYRARDTRSGREVVVEVLPIGASSDADRLKRFEKEARSASSPNHPNMVTIHDIGESGGTSFIAREMVHGQTLRQVVTEGALPTKRPPSVQSSKAPNPDFWGENLHLHFENQAVRTPEAVAVSCEGQQLTYRELNGRANQLADYLRSMGVARDVIVAMYLERSIEMIVGIVGILKAGGAYLPLDIDHPPDRLAFMLEDAQAKVVLSTTQLLPKLRQRKELSVVCLDTDWQEIAKRGTVGPHNITHPDDPAYVIYTSGSTGEPKGVVVTHRNVMRLFRSTACWYDFGPADVWAQFHSYAFDVSVWEIWGALLYGGRLVIVPHLVSRTPSAFYELLDRERVTVLNQTPSAFRQLVWAEACAEEKRDLALRYVVLAGEALDVQSLRPWLERHGAHKPLLINMYGTTETTVHATYHRIGIEDLAPGKGNLIGRPIPDLDIYLMDDQRRPVPPGAVGEIYVGGAGLARGYLNRAKLNAERFIAHPFNASPGDRLYKTGDLGRLFPNGDLQYVGRCDDQVKILGFRIELGEIQSVLSGHPAVRECCVTAPESVAGDKRLIAYVVAHPGRQVSVSDLRTWLKRKLPQYMVPAVFMFLEALPLTPNGKIDRRALPAPDHARPELNQAYVPPHTREERALAAIWSEVLEVQPVGVDDSFFDLGGDSIRVVQALARAQQGGINLGLQDFLEQRTIRSLVRRLEQKRTPAAPAQSTARFSLLSAEERLRLPAGLEDAYPMLELQMGMAYHNQMKPASAMFHDIAIFRIRFPFLAEKMETSISHMVQRHACLRTSFDLTHFGRPLQFVHETVHLPLEVEDLRRVSPEEQLKSSSGWPEDEKRRSFAWTKAPLARIRIHLHKENEFLLMLSYHHAILDGWSVAAMVTELLQEYWCLVKEKGEPIPAPSIAYREYVALEQRALRDGECRRFWTAKLENLEPQRLPRWPESHRVSGPDQVRGPEIRIPEEVLESLTALAQAADTPLKSVFLAAHQRVMSFLFATSDVTTGLITHGRPEEADAERMLGLFLNTVPFRSRLAGGTWVDLVRQVFADERELMHYRRYPLAEMKRVTGGQLVLETAFDFVNFHVYRNLRRCGDLGFEQLYSFDANNFVLMTTVAADVATTQMGFHIDYDPEELSADQIAAISGYYSNTLTAMAAQPAARYHDFSPLPPEERQRLLVDWNRTQRDFARDQRLHDLFHEQVERTPDAAALVFGQERWSYKELNRRANLLARRLMSKGVGPDVVAGVCVERCPEMVAAILGILKAGGAYVPLDPAFPADWLHFALEDTQARVLLTQSKLLPHLPKSGAEIICLDDSGLWDEGLRASHDSAPDGGARGNSLAYVIFTSGSTGRPKGVAVEHRSPVALVHWAREIFTNEELTGVLASTSISFDLSIFEIFACLCSGGKLILAENLLQLPTLPARQEVTLINTVPSAMAELLRLDDVPRSVQVVNLAGEPSTVSLVRRIYELPWIAKVYDLYGPTETTVYSTFALRRAEGPYTIGKPITNTQIYLLDSRREPVPVGVPGEIYIGGQGLAREYLRRPELTEEKFVRNLFSSEPDARLYKTGDLARYMPDGNIEFLGRSDHQVKLRGFRIELGEIEAALRTHTGVDQAVVLAREDTPGEKRLVAYVVPAPASSPSPAQLRQHIEGRLPDHMLPSTFVTLAALPLTPRGKVDRKALPVPEPARPESSSSYVAPRNSVEQAVANIWAEVLKLDRVGVHDNFFELGGDSLLAMRVLSRLRASVDQRMSVRELFDLPTIAQLSAVIAVQAVSPARPPL